MSAATLHCSSDDGEPSGTGGKGGGSGGKASGGTAGKGGTTSGGRSAGGGEAGEPPVLVEGGAGGAGGSGGAPVDEAPLDLYVGCRDPLKGSIQHYKLAATGEVTLSDTALATAEVSNTAWNEAQDILYVAHTDTGRITWFNRDTATGTLALGGLVIVPGAPLATDNPATQTLEVDKTGKFLLAANYAANTVQVFKILPGGGVGALVETITNGTNAHQTVLNSTNKFALVPYYGSNTIGVYNFNATSGALTPHATVPLTVIPAPPASSGPRHLALHENNEWLYAITENAGSIVFFDFDNVAGTLAHNETISALPADFPAADAKGGSEIEIAPGGKFLYVSNRLDPAKKGILGAYSISEVDGKLTPIDHYETGGSTPRHFSLSPNGELLVVGNQTSANMSVFKVDTTDGTLTLVETTDTCEFPFFARMAVSAE